MVANAYMSGRKKYGRPQAMIWADNPGYVDSNGFHIPEGNEIGSNVLPSGSGNFIILSDDNRSPIDFKTNRIEKRERMVNGRMRSYHIADKLELSTSWDMLPSRSHKADPDFQLDDALYYEGTGKSKYKLKTQEDGLTPNELYDPQGQYTSDGGAGGVELLDWYENNQGSFWVYLSYDKYSNFGKTDSAFNNLTKYSQVIEVYFSDFSYSVVKRGGTNYDFWNVSVSLEEV